MYFVNQIQKYLWCLGTFNINGDRIFHKIYHFWNFLKTVFWTFSQKGVLEVQGQEKIVSKLKRRFGGSTFPPQKKAIVGVPLINLLKIKLLNGLFNSKNIFKTDNNFSKNNSKNPKILTFFQKVSQATSFRGVYCL